MKNTKFALISVDETVSMLGIRDLSAQLKSNGYDVKVLSMQGNPEKNKFTEKQLSFLEDFIEDVTVVGVSSIAINKLKAVQVMEVARSKNKKTIWGGVHATLFPEECVKHCDFVCIGEGEKALLDYGNAIENGEDPSNINNLSYYNSETDKVVRNPLNPLILDLDSQPFPDHDIENQYIIHGEELSTISDYLHKTVKLHGRNRYIYIYSSKGCPFCCAYCSNSKLNEIYEGDKTRVRFKSVSRIIEELKILQKIYPNFDKVWIMDDSFMIRSAKDLNKFKEMYIRYVNLPLDFFASPSMIREDKIEALLPIDISLIRIGVQSGSNNTLENIFNRNIDREYAVKTSQILSDINKKHNTDISAVYQFIINNPYESTEDLLSTYELISRLKPPFYISMFFLIYFPGSKLYERAMSEGIITEDNSLEEFLAEDVGSHLKADNANLYMNSFLFWLHGSACKDRVGAVPRSLMEKLTDRKMIDFFNANPDLILAVNEEISKNQESLTEWLDSFKSEN